MKNTELKRKIISFLIIALMLSSVFSGAVMVLASVNTTINDTSTDDEVQIDTDTAHPTIIDHSPTSDNAYVNASIQVTFSEAMNETSVEDAFSIHPSVVGSFDWDGNEMNFIPDILSYSTAYDISINEEASDLAGNSLESSYSWEFTTKSQGQDQDIDADTKSPIISDVSTVNIITNSPSIIITWRTDKPSDSLVKYGTKTGKYTLFANDPSFVTEHSTKIIELLPSTTYYYVVNSTDSSGNQNESVEYNFNTQSESEEIVDLSPPIITFVSPTPPNNSVINESEISINITANEYLDIAILDWNGTNETMHGSEKDWYIDKSLTNGTYIYKVYGTDTADNWAVSGTRTITVLPPTPTAPFINDLFNNTSNDNSTSITINKSQSILISDVSTVNITANSTTITWRTDEPSDSLVKYGTETGNYTLFANDPSFVTEHSIKITGLLSCTTYYYVVNSTDSSKNQNESAEYNFNTLSEAEEIVDVSPPTLTFVAPTPSNNSVINESEIIITITANEYLDIAILDWNGTNETMQGSGKDWYIHKSLTPGTYIYRVYGTDTADNWAVSGTRTVTITVVPPTKTAPFIADLFNNITNDNSISITINKSQSIFFSATADQDIDTWHWYKDGIDQLNNCDSYTTSFKASGSYSVAVNATNANGTSNTVVFNIAVTDVTISISDVSTVNITANSTTIIWRTDKPSDSLVKYGTETGSYTLFANDPSFVSEHSIKITGLLPSTTYYYVVNSTDSSGTQNESAEYDFNTLSEAEEIVDVSPPTLTFVAPTPPNNSIVSESEIIINITANEYLDIAILDWNGTNETMQGSGRNWYIHKILTNGTYIYMVHGNDTADNWAVSGTRTVTVVPPAPAAPFIIDLFNNITNDNSTSITINKSQSIFFGATADQDIDTWHWYKDGVDQLNNWSSYTTSFNASGSYSVAVNATNANGTSNTAIFNIAVTEVTILISNVSTVNITANSTTIMWRTDEPSDSLVKYGTETGNYTLFANDPSFVSEHSIKITGLLPNTTYYYVVNSTDSSGTQNESAEYDFNTLLEAEEIVDVSPPTLTFVAPTPPNNSIVSESEIIINITANEYLDIAILDWNGTNETMQGSGRNWSITKILTNGTYIYMVYGNDTADNWAVSGTRTVTITVLPPAPPAPLIIDLFNNISNDNSTSITINKSQSIFFGATADQDIDTWHWYRDGIDQLNNCDSYTTTFNASGSYSVAVNATNANGVSNTAIFNIAVTDVTILILDVSSVNITANSTTITWRTDKPSDSLVKYGTETGNYTLFANDPSFVSEHSIKITGLLPNTTYYYVVNSTDPSGSQKESVEYNFNTLPEAEEIVDVSPPTLTFVAPTPANNSIVNESEITINITANEYLDLAILDWNGTNETMQGSGKDWYITKNLTNGTYIYMVYGNDTAGNWAVSGTRTVTVVPSTRTAPLINDLFNNITNDNSTSITINKSQSIFFGATADQDIDTWHWYKDDIDQLNNWSSYTTSFNASGSYYVAVNATNANGVSNTAIFNISVTNVTISKIPTISGAPISGDWVISGTESYSDQEIILNGNLNILGGASLTLNNVTLIMNSTANGQRTITIEQWGSLYTDLSNITGNYYYYFRNYGYLNMQNSSVSTAYSIEFYDSSDDSSIITNSTIKNTAGRGIYMEHASPTIIDNTISDSGSYGLYAYYASPTINDNTISDSGSYGLYAYYSSPNIINNTISGSSNYGIYLYHTTSPRIENNTIKNNDNGGIYMYYSSPTIINNLIDKNGQYGVYVTSSSYLEWLSASCTLKGSVHRYLHIPILGSVHRIPFIINST